MTYKPKKDKYVILKLADILLGGETSALLAVDRMSFLLWLELGLGAVVPMILLFIPAVRAHWLGQWVGPVLILLGVFMSRFSATMFAQLPPPGTVYSPHVLEWLSTIGILAGAALLWYLGVRYLALFDVHDQGKNQDTPDEERRIA